MIANPTIPTIVDPKLVDYPIEELRAALASGLSWLDEAYPKCFKAEEVYEGRKRTFPALYYGKLDYHKLIPDEHIGNFCFFDAKLGDDVEWNRTQKTWVETPISLIFWFNFEKIYPSDYERRTIEHVKAEILEFLQGATMSNGLWEFNKIYDRPSEVYRGYTFVYSDPDWIGTERIAVEAGNLFFMRPYGCLRFDGTVRFLQRCPV